MPVLPEPTPTATAAGQATNPLTDAVISAAVDNAIEKAKRQGTSPEVVIGNAAPVEQPGRPSMSQRAVDLNTTILCVGATSLPVGGMTALVLHVLGTVDPAQLALGAAAPAALAVPILAVARLIRRAGEAQPDVHHHHYNAPVDQRTVESKTTGIFAKTNNRQSR
ncbi:hypothetical protein AAW14_06340 [Streptomyces hygroscopicus]|uniref:hypothetical protein n=1 Tax=Streptomyces hygroscopicus TaxID=1912 RepID=UPI002240D45D|nr:hypothetical protein [Streptomyces hygroscopicus]MCW7941660.1 hypothetical protein [Streptomyces hygroscopicus]